jgi:hypothetical protein
MMAVGSTVTECGSYLSDMDVCMLVPSGDAIRYTSERGYVVFFLLRVLFCSFAVRQLRNIGRTLRSPPYRSIIHSIEHVVGRLDLLRIVIVISIVSAKSTCTDNQIENESTILC